jgi:hypothetical protein
LPGPNFVADSQRPPAFTGLIIHRDPERGYSLLLPEGWHRSALADGTGAFYAPDPSDPMTGLEASARDLGTEVQPGDLAVLRRGFLAGLRQLPECSVERQEAEAVGRLLTLEARLTYSDGDATRKRWSRLLYQGRVQVKLVAQGATVERFEHWESMFYTAMRTVRFGDWWSEAVGIEWTERAFADDDAASLPLLPSTKAPSPTPPPQAGEGKPRG